MGEAPELGMVFGDYLIKACPACLSVTRRTVEQPAYLIAEQNRVFLSSEIADARLPIVDTTSQY